MGIFILEDNLIQQQEIKKIVSSICRRKQISEDIYCMFGSKSIISKAKEIPKLNIFSWIFN